MYRFMVQAYSLSTIYASRRSWFWGLAIAASLGVMAAANAGAYKTIGPDGRVIYSDRPLADAEPLALPHVSEPAREAGGTSAADGFPGPYQAFEVLAPQAGETLNPAEGRVSVSLLLDPPLVEGDQLMVEVDGTPVAGLAGRTQFVLQGLPPGSHQLQARILDEAGTVIAQSAMIHFNLRPSTDEDLP